MLYVYYMMTFKINKKWVIGCITLVAVTGYIILTIIPNMFIMKKIDPENVKKTKLIIAHRGGAGMGLENTLSCIEKGIASGADMIEIDIHLTKDGFLLVCHDEKVDRTTNGSGKIQEMTLEEIRKLRIVDEKGIITEEYIPTLSEVMELVKDRTQLLIEIKRTKNTNQGIEQKLMDEIEKFNASSWVVVQSFNDSVLENIHAINPQQRLEKLFFFKFLGLPFIFDGTLTRFSFKKYSYIASFNIFYKSASLSIIKKIHNQGKEVKVWKLNKKQRIPNLPVDGIITYHPDLWKQLINE